MVHKRIIENKLPYSNNSPSEANVDSGQNENLSQQFHSDDTRNELYPDCGLHEVPEQSGNNQMSLQTQTLVEATQGDRVKENLFFILESPMEFVLESQPPNEGKQIVSFLILNIIRGENEELDR